MSNPLNPQEIQAALKTLPGWHYQSDCLSKEFHFQNFREAISFIVRLSFHAEALNHHPEIRNVYHRVEIRLTTHDVGNQVTQKDLQLAQEIESFNWLS